jgi:hypothetical protein
MYIFKFLKARKKIRALLEKHDDYMAANIRGLEHQSRDKQMYRELFDALKLLQK